MFTSDEVRIAQLEFYYLKLQVTNENCRSLTETTGHYPVSDLLEYF